MRLFLKVKLILLTLAIGACSSTPDHQTLPRVKPQPGPGDEVALQAMSMIGKPYRWGGTSPHSGFDCSGLAQYAWRKAAGVKLPRQAAQMSRAGRKVSRKRLVPGDLVFFNTQRRRYSDVGVYVGSGRFVHAPAKGQNIRLARLANPYWRKRYNGARRPRHK